MIRTMGTKILGTDIHETNNPTKEGRSISFSISVDGHVWNTFPLLAIEDLVVIRKELRKYINKHKK